MRYDPDYAFFAAWDDPDALRAIVAPGEIIAPVVTSAGPVPQGFTVEREHPAVQMVAEAVARATLTDILALDDSDAPAMRALAELTEPGPFFARTHQLGRFVGVRENGVLVAMAGERMRLPGYREVSAVCTHPDHRGRGLAAALTRHVARRILDEGEVPFLHAFQSNAGAIALYQALGFGVRRSLVFTILRRTP